MIRRSAAQQRALDDYVATLQDRSSRGHYKWLTPEQYGAEYGITESDFGAVESWLQSHGFQIDRVPKARNVIEFSGTVDQVQSVFHTAIHIFLVNGERHFANISNPQIPVALAPVVADIGPLNDFRPRPMAKLGARARYDTEQHVISPQMTLSGNNNPPNLFVVPADAATIYDTPNPALNPSYSGPIYDGTGVNIGVVEDSNVTIQDIENYRMAFLGETATTANLPTVVIDGNDPGVNGDEIEALIDTEIAGGIAPKAKVFLYTSESGVSDSLLRALGDNVVNILNFSFSECEADLGNSGNAFTLEWAEQAAAQGISVTVASGDTGSAGCDGETEAKAQFGLTVNGAASVPWTIAVGGTDFDTLPANFSTYAGTTSSAPYYGTAKSYIPEEPWNDSTSVNTSIVDNVAVLNSSGYTNIVAAGGGASNCAMQDSSGNCVSGYAKPSFQTSLTPNDSVRDVPDVALFSGNDFYQAVWTICSDNVANEDPTSTYTDCQTTNGQLASSSTFSGYGGTSTSAPAFAGILALVSQEQGGARLGQADYVLYQLAQSKYGTIFHDTTVGDNSVPCFSGSPNCGSNSFLTGFNASTGYDQASGLGSVDVAALVNNWSSVSLGSTSTTLDIDGSNAAVAVSHGTPLTFNVGVTPASATGVVGIIDTANAVSGGPLLNGQLGIPLSNGSGSATYNGMPGGSYTVAARYGGDASDAVSTSTPIDVTISPENAAVTISGAGCFPPPLNTLCFGLGPGTAPFSVPYGSGIGFQAQISGTSADENKNGTQGVATGTVAFASGNTVIGTVPVGNSNQVSWPQPTAAFPSMFIPAGTYNIVAEYSGDASFNPSASPSISLTITKTGSFTTVSSNPASVDLSGSVTLTVGLSSWQGATPTGTVTLTANGNALASVTNQNPAAIFQGTATIQASQLAIGPNIITASYSGDNNYLPSSSTVQVTVTGTPAFGFVLGNSGNIAILPSQSTGNSTISVTPSGGFTGQVNLSCAITSVPTTDEVDGTFVPITCGVAASVSISGGALTTPLAVTAPHNTTVGTYVVTISGANAATGQLMATTDVTVAVGPTYGFAMNNSGDLTVVAGDTATNAAWISFVSFGGFSGTVNTSCTVSTTVPNVTALPTCTFESSQAVDTAGSVAMSLAVNTTSATTTGSYVVTVTGTDGTLTASTWLNVTFTPYSSGVTLSNTGSITVPIGGSGSTTLNVTPFGGFTGQIDLQCGWWSTSMTGPIAYGGGCTIPSSVTVTGTSAATATVTVKVDPRMTPGPWTVQVAGQNNSTGVVVYSPVNVNVIEPTDPSFTLSNSGNLSVTAGESVTSTITVTPSAGYTGLVNLTCGFGFAVVNPPIIPSCSVSPASLTISGAGSVTATLTVTTASLLPAGAYSVIIAGQDSVTGAAASTSINLTVVQAPAGYTLSNSGNISVNPGATGNATITATASGGFTGQFTLYCTVSTTIANPVDLPGCSLNPTELTIATGASAATSTLTVTTGSNTAAGAYAVLVVGEGGGFVEDTTVNVTVNPAAATFSLSNSGNISVNPGTSGTSTITATPTGGYAGQINLTCAVSTAISNPTDPPTCLLNPASLTISASSQTSTLMIATTGATSNTSSSSEQNLFAKSTGIAFALLIFLYVPTRRRGWRCWLLIAGLLFAFSFAGCGGSGGGGNQGGGGTTAGTYTVTITGTDAATGKLTANTTVTLMVN